MPQISELAKAAASTALVEAGDGEGAGSVIKHAGVNSFVLTCRHVVGDAGARVQVACRDGVRWTKVRGVVERADVENDLALVRTTRRINAPILALAAEEPEIYSRIYGIGNGSQFRGVAFEGVLTGRDGSAGISAPGYLFTGLAIEGMSGGPIINDDGEQVGVIRARDRHGHLPVFNIGHAVPLPEIMRFLRDHGKFAKRKRPR